jgi:hypothetical protein
MTSPWTALIQKFDVVIRRVAPDRIAVSSVETAQQTFDFSGGDADLIVTLDGGAPQVITIVAASLAVPGAATATEIAAQVDAALVGGEAYETADGSVVVATDTAGASGSVVVSGAAEAILGFSITDMSGGGYDDTFGAVRPHDDGTQHGQPGRRERAPVTIRCQLDLSNSGEQEITVGGKTVSINAAITVKTDDLVTLGLMDANNKPVFSVGDRIDRILRIDGSLERKYPNPPGLWIVRVEPLGYGLAYFGTPKVNLWDLHCSEDRITP